MMRSLSIAILCIMSGWSCHLLNCSSAYSKELKMGDEIQKNYFYLTKKLTNLKQVLIYLIQHDVISTDEQEDIDAERTSAGKNMKLLSTLAKKDWMRVRNLFLDLLRRTNNGHCADEIEGIKTETAFNQSKIFKAKWWPEKHFLTEPFHLQSLELDLLQELHEGILNNENRMVSITESVGTWKYFPFGGAGKSLWAKWYGHSYEKHYEHILWIDCREESMLSCFQKLARDVRVKNYNRLQDAEDYARKSYEILEGLTCLWIFDNVENCQELLKVLPKYKENFYCIMTSRRKEAIDQWGYLQISQLELDIVSNKKILNLLINEKHKTKTAKFNYAVALHNKGHTEECLSIVEQLFSRRQTGENELTRAVQIIFTSLPTHRIGINENQFGDLNREVTETDIGIMLIYSYLQMGNYQEALTTAKQIVTDIGHLFQILSITQVTNYHLRVNINEIDLNLAVETKKIHLYKCSLSLNSFNRLVPEDLTLKNISFFRDGLALKDVRVKDFIDLINLERLTLRCDKKKNVVILDMSGDICMEYLHLIDVRILNWENSNWNVKHFFLDHIPFVQQTNINVQEFTIGYSSCDISCLSQATQKITLDRVELSASGRVELPNLNYLTLKWMDDLGCLCHFGTAPITRIHLVEIKEINVDLLPQTLTHLKITNHNIRVIGGVRKLDKLILEHLSFREVDECLRQFQTDNFVVHYFNPLKGKDLVQFINKPINTMAVGTIEWGNKDFKKYSSQFDRQAAYYVLEGGRGRAMHEQEFDKIMKLF